MQSQLKCENRNRTKEIENRLRQIFLEVKWIEGKGLDLIRTKVDGCTAMAKAIQNVRDDTPPDVLSMIDLLVDSLERIEPELSQFFMNNIYCPND